MEVLENFIMDTKIPAQLQKVEIGKTVRALMTKEIESSEILWVKTVQTKIQDTLSEFKDDAEKLKLQLDKTHRIYICKGHITGDYPISIPANTSMNKSW